MKGSPGPSEAHARLLPLGLRARGDRCPLPGGGGPEAGGLGRRHGSTSQGGPSWWQLGCAFLEGLGAGGCGLEAGALGEGRADTTWAVPSERQLRHVVAESLLPL